MLNKNEHEGLTYMNGECTITIKHVEKTQDEIDKILKDIALFYKRKLRK